MPESFGARLRSRREEQGIALVTVAERTKIKLALLEALERDELASWPSGFYRRAFIRAYAHAVGLTADVVVREFLEAHPEQADIDPPAPAGDDARALAGPPTRLRYIVGSAIDSLSRFRRSPTVEHQPAAASTTVDVPAPVELVEIVEPVEPVESVEPVEAERLAPVEPDLPASVQPDLAAPVPSDLPAAAPPPAEPSPVDLDFLTVAELCTGLGRARNATQVQALLQETAGVLDAAGLIVWVWDASAAELRPAWAHGYSDKVLERLPTVGRDDDNPTAAAFRSGQTCASGGEHSRGALVVPLLTPGGCAGVLAIELQGGRQQTPSMRAAATIIAALLAQLIGDARPEEIQTPSEMSVAQPSSR